MNIILNAKYIKYYAILFSYNLYLNNNQFVNETMKHEFVNWSKIQRTIKEWISKSDYLI